MSREIRPSGMEGEVWWEVLPFSEATMIDTKDPEWRRFSGSFLMEVIGAKDKGMEDQQSVYEGDYIEYNHVLYLGAPNKTSHNLRILSERMCVNHNVNAVIVCLMQERERQARLQNSGQSQ